MLPAEHRDARRLQVLKGAREVEERLRARAYRDDGMAGERVEVRGDVAGQLGPPVHAAATAMSRSATFLLPARTRSSSPGSRPARAFPSRMAVTAGSAPPARTAARHRRRASPLAGAGSPSREKIVDSRATTGRPAASAAETAPETVIASRPRAVPPAGLAPVVVLVMTSVLLSDRVPGGGRAPAATVRARDRG